MTPNPEVRRETLTALEWRKDATRCGGGFSFHRPSCKCVTSAGHCACPIDECEHNIEDDCVHCCGTDGPEIDLDPGIALVELMRFCAANSFAWWVGTAPSGEIACGITRGDFVVGVNPIVGQAKAETPALAICAALIAAARKVKS